MKLLVNYDAREQAYLPVLQYHLKNRGLQAVATNLAMTPGELVAKAKSARCEAILICNEATLRSCVEGKKPTLDLFRGSLLQFTIPAIVCNSLAHTQTVEHGAWLLGKDLDKFLLLNQINQHRFSHKVLETQKEMLEAYHVLKNSVAISYDIETKTTSPNDDTLEGGDTFITCASWTAISASGTLSTYVLPLVDFLETHFKNKEDYAYALRFLQNVNKLDVPKVMHNGMYDALHSIVYHAEPHNWFLDTMAMAHSEFSSLPKSLDFVASITLPDYIQWKTDSEEASRTKNIEQYWAYNAKDTWYTARILLHYLRKLPAYAKKNYSQLFPLVYPFLYTAFEGIQINQDTRKELRDKAEKKLGEALVDLRKMVKNDSFNPASPKQVQFYIYDIFGANDPKIGFKKDAKTGKRAKKERGTDEKNLLAIGEQHPILFLFTSALLKYRENAKAISTYFDFYQRNSRLLYSLNPFGTDTGRSSCQSSSFWCGTQAQNIPPYAKDMLVADEGFTLIEIDNSQSEARCTAYLSQETNLIKALETPDKDFYKSLGTLFFGIPYEEVTKEFRNAFLKKIVHGTNYMMGAGTFVENAGVENLLVGASKLGVKITLKQKSEEGERTIKEFANDALESYHKPFPRVRVWYKEVSNDIATKHMLVSPLGYTRYFFGDILKNHNMLRGAVAHGPQNLSVAILNIGLMKVWKLLKDFPQFIRLKAQIHDSVFLQIRDDVLEEFLPKVLERMDNKVVIHGRTLSIPVDYKYGKSWGNMTEVK